MVIIGNNGSGCNGYVFSLPTFFPLTKFAFEGKADVWLWLYTYWETACDSWRFPATMYKCNLRFFTQVF